MGRHLLIAFGIDAKGRERHMLLEIASTPGKKSQVIGVPVFEDFTYGGPQSPIEKERFVERGFSGAVGQALWLYDGHGWRVLLGTGKRDRVCAESIRCSVAYFVQECRNVQYASLFVNDLIPSGVSRISCGQVLAEGALLGEYEFTRYKTKAGASTLEELTLVVEESYIESLRRGINLGKIIAAGVVLARDLVNEPGGELTPSRFVEVAEGIALANGLVVDVWDRQRLLAEGMGGVVAVAAGSSEAPYLLKLSYIPKKDNGTVVLVGKGVTFDSGGLSLKSAVGMTHMKTDMAGAAAVLGAMSVLREAGVSVRVVGFLPVIENMPGEHAMKPGDVLRIRNGCTIEVINTDAEGRLVLADALCLAAEMAPCAIVDIATLTRGALVALGREVAAMMGNHRGWLDQVRQAAYRAGEEVWELPLVDSYRPLIESSVADLKNVAASEEASPIVAGLVLREFVNAVPWVHLDIAGRSSADVVYQRGGATGFGVRTLVEVLRGFERLEPLCGIEVGADEVCRGWPLAS